MAVAGEAELQAQRGEIVVLAEQIEGPREAQAQLIPIQRHAFHLLKDLREIYGRAADLGGDLSERPAARQICREYELHSIHEFLPTHARLCVPLCAWPERTTHECQRQTLGFQLLRDTATQTVPKKRDERLRARIDAQPLLAECKISLLSKQRLRRQLAQHLGVDRQIETGIAALHRM